MILALFKAKKFFEGRKPTIDDVKVLSDRISTVTKTQTPESLAQMREITRIVL